MVNPGAVSRPFQIRIWWSDRRPRPWMSPIPVEPFLSTRGTTVVRAASAAGSVEAAGDAAGVGFSATGAGVAGSGVGGAALAGAGARAVRAGAGVGAGLGVAGA